MAKPIHFIKEDSQTSICGRDIFINGMKATYLKPEIVTCVQCLKLLHPEKKMDEIRDMLVIKDAYTNVKSRV